jgi:hypothetical protein
MDKPDNPITIEKIDGSYKWEGRAALLNRVNADRVLVFCLSTQFDEHLFYEFSAGTCIEIVDPVEFLRRISRVIARQQRFVSSGLLHRPVVYYAPNKALEGDVRDVRFIPFVKHFSYAHQAEYRLVAALNGGLRLSTHIVNELFTLDEDLSNAKPTERIVRVGSLLDLCRVHSRQHWGGSPNPAAPADQKAPLS